VGAFDVLEHIHDDEKVMQNLYQSLKPGGYFFLTVPQHPFLWSFQDDFAGHKRRYTRSELLEKLLRTGFCVDYVSSFCTSVFPLLVLVRRARKAPSKTSDQMQQALAEFQISAPLNSILRAVIRLDEVLIARDCSLPFGGSLVAVARKPSH
jgi:SAM-dependent methyltransferase